MMERRWEIVCREGIVWDRGWKMVCGEVMGHTVYGEGMGYSGGKGWRILLGIHKSKGQW